MQQGHHETVVTDGLERELSRELTLDLTYAAVDDADQAHVLLRHVDGVLARRLEAIRDPARRLAFVNESWATSRRAMSSFSSRRVNCNRFSHPRCLTGESPGSASTPTPQ